MFFWVCLGRTSRVYEFIVQALLFVSTLFVSTLFVSTLFVSTLFHRPYVL